MGLLDTFLNLVRPRHKHSDPVKRADYVRQLDADDAKALAEVARTDPDAQIRRIALKKIDDATLLAELAQSDPDEGIRRAAGEKADEILISAATGDDVGNLHQRLMQQRHGLGEVDDVDVVAGAEDVLRHLRVPAMRLVAEVNASLEQLTHGKRRESHGKQSLFRLDLRAA